MQVLEKILEEIIDELKEEGVIIDDEKGNRAVEIIRSHMDNDKDTNVPTDDGWIPVEERLPESKTHVLCCFENGAVDSLWQDWKESGFGGYFDDDFKPMEVVAWQPLPDPYKPKKDITVAGTEHVMSRFMKVE